MSENAQRWKRIGWKSRASLAVNSFDSICTKGCANSSGALVEIGDFGHDLEGLPSLRL